MQAPSGRFLQRGFSLVEMAIATLLVSIFLTLGLGALNVQQENTAASTTQKNLDAIRDAFVNYVRTNRRLPCPDTQPANGFAPDGREDPVGGNCAIAFGTLPYLDLGLARESALDGWGNLYSYHVSISTAGGARNWSLSAPFVSPGNPGTLTIQDRNSSSPFALYSLSSIAVAVVISHGRNGLGAYTTRGTRITLPTAADELENTNGTANTTYVRRTRTESETATGGVFDDYVMYVSADDLLGPLVKEGSIKWANVQVEEDLLKIKNAIFGYIVATSSNRSGAACTSSSASLNCKRLPYSNTNPCTNGTVSSGQHIGCVPDVSLNLGTAAARLKDPWGYYYQYTLGNPDLGANGNDNGIGSDNLACATSGTAYTLSSYGSDGMLGGSGGAADYIVTVSCAELRGTLGSKLPP